MPEARMPFPGAFFIALMAPALVLGAQSFLREADAPRAIFGEAATATRKTLELTDAELVSLGEKLGRAFSRDPFFSGKFIKPVGGAPGGRDAARCAAAKHYSGFLWGVLRFPALTRSEQKTPETPVRSVVTPAGSDAGCNGYLGFAIDGLAV